VCTENFADLVFNPAVFLHLYDRAVNLQGLLFFDSSFSNCSPYIICSFCIFFNAQNDMGAKGMLAPVSCKIYLVLSYKNIQMGFLAETATEKRYIYHNIRTRF
jgi:hypothetical protein